MQKIIGQLYSAENMRDWGGVWELTLLTDSKT